VTLSAANLAVLQDGTAATVNATVTGGSSNPITLSVSGAPAAMNVTVQSPGTGTTGQVTFSTGGPLVPPWEAPPSYVPTPAGTYTVTVNATDGVSTGSATLTLQVNVVAAVYPTSAAPPSYPLQTLNTFMTTSFQPASWTDQFFVQNPGATTTLNNLQPQHIRMQVLERDIPQTTATTWDFSYLDGIVNPILGVADHSPEFQIARGPDFMYDSTGQTFLDPTYKQFAGFAADLVQYYNKGSFTDGSGVTHTHSTAYPITWWGIYNEPNINGLTAAQYVSLYNTVVPAMQAVDSTLKFAAVELADFGNEPQNYLPTFVSGVTAHVDVVATHFYSTCNQQDSDQTIFDSITNYLPHIPYIYSQLQTNPALANVPVWMTENNVNADYSDANGYSVCNPGQKFVTDQRGTSAFFAAWRPTIFSKLAQAGVHALYHWDFNADAQYGEVNGSNDQTYLSYWVDYWLSRIYASPPGAQILPMADPDNATVEVLPTRYGDGSVVIMVANHAVHNPADNNGSGDPRTAIVDVSALGSFTTATALTLDATTNITTGPSPVSLTVAPRIPITLNGYGVTFVTLK
jgi:hypothetical protein